MKPHQTLHTYKIMCSSSHCKKSAQENTEKHGKTEKMTAERGVGPSLRPSVFLPALHHPPASSERHTFHAHTRQQLQPTCRRSGRNVKKPRRKSIRALRTACAWHVSTLEAVWGGQAGGLFFSFPLTTAAAETVATNRHKAMSAASTLMMFQCLMDSY